MNALARNFAQWSTWRADKKRLLMILLGLIVGIEFFENGMFVFGASHIVGGVDAGPREFAQVQAAYAIGSMLMIVMQQSLSRHFGYRRYLVGSLSLFMVGAAASASAQGLGGLTAARLVQGIGGGALFTSSRVLIPLLFTPAERPRATRHYMLILFAMSALAPALAAWLVEDWGWRWVFISVLPLAALLIFATWTLLPDGAGRGGEPVQWAAGPLLLVAVALTLLQVALSDARYDVFAHPVQLAVLAGAGAALLLWFLYHQWHHEAPLMRLRELRHPAFAVGLGLYFLHYLLSNATSYLFPIYAERALGLPLYVTGWLNTFAAVVSLGGAWVYVKFGSKLTRKKLVMAGGALLMVAAAWMFAGMPPGAPASALVLPLVAKGFFGVLLVLPVAGLTFRSVREEHFPHAYQSKNLMRQIAGSFSTAIAAITMQDRQFANLTRLQGELGPANPAAHDWIATMQSALAARGIAPGEAHAAAQDALAHLLDQQALLLSCEDVYRLLAVLAAATAVIALVQRRLK